MEAKSRICNCHEQYLRPIYVKNIIKAFEIVLLKKQLQYAKKSREHF